MDVTVRQRAAIHAALGEPVRLAIVDELTGSDRTPSALAARFELPGNLLAHHLDALERVGLIERIVSAGDRRRRYVRLRRRTLDDLDVPRRRWDGRALFVCTRNAARSPIAAALWRRRTGAEAASAGTHPAERTHPGALAAAQRVGLDLDDGRPRPLDDSVLAGQALVVTVCDRAHEELHPHEGWLHWSIPDPADIGSDDAFDAALAEIDERIASLTAPPNSGGHAPA